MIFEQIFKQIFLFGQAKQKEDGMNVILKTLPSPPLVLHTSNAKHYTLSGKPCSLSKSRDLAFKGWTSQKSAVAACESQLLEQHRDEPLFTGLLHIDIIFHFVPTSAQKRELLRGKLCKDGPRLDGLIKFVEKVCSGVICSEDAEIVSVSAKKLYDTNAHTELLISRY